MIFMRSCKLNSNCTNIMYMYIYGKDSHIPHVEPRINKIHKLPFFAKTHISGSHKINNVLYSYTYMYIPTYTCTCTCALSKMAIIHVVILDCHCVQKCCPEESKRKKNEMVII